MIKIAEKKHGREEGRPEIEQLNAYKVFQTGAIKKDLDSRQNRNLHKMNHGWNFRRCWVFLFSPIMFFKQMNFLLIEIYGYFMTKLITLKWFMYSWLFNMWSLIHIWASLVGKSQPFKSGVLLHPQSQPTTDCVILQYLLLKNISI